MTTLREAAKQAVEYMKSVGKMDMHPEEWAIVGRLEAALAEPVLQTCNCRWDGEVQVQQCTLHEAHVDAIHEWAERAKTAEKKLAALAEPDSDSPERRCGGPGCDGTCCQPVQEPQGCAHCNHPLYAAIKCRVCGRVTKAVQEPVAKCIDDICSEHLGRVEALDYLPRGTILFTTPPQRRPLTVERLRDALVASRIVPPAAVEDPDEYDDGVTLYRIEALHRRLA